MLIKLSFFFAFFCMEKKRDIKKCTNSKSCVIAKTPRHRWSEQYCSGVVL